MKKIVLVAALVVAGCGQDQQVNRRAEALAQQYLLIDTHIDVPYRMTEKPADVGLATQGGDFDYPRASRGGLNAPFMSIYIPAEKESDGSARAYADQLIDLVEGLVAQHPDKFAIPHSVAEMEQQVASGHISLPLGMENGAAIAGDLQNLQHFAERGVRYITLTHSKSNHISDSSYDEQRQWRGLSEFGKQLVVEMNRVGVMVDVSHISDAAFWQVMEISEVPVIASHSSARHFTPGFERNMSDEMIRALADKGGVIMINFGSTFISAASRQSREKIRAATDEFMRERGLNEDSEEVSEFEQQLTEDTFVYAELDDVLDHFDHVRELVGVDYIGIGSDYDGVGDSLPMGLKDVSQYPNLIRGLLERNYSEADIEKILGGNLLRVWRANETYARARREGEQVQR
ncbi:membrane dipeptidase [Microbulbifer donghaiensis]|uniref:Membrane dipeptidase n=1 Tax=Microbulbifer donghaiensis TaxID=494016 RepID=A0A1M5AWT8_9GAMM|nr:dipeptidase [Microbulbifer donghaiensis]SHF34708.1 membrane dipeptidase [Microbulbifer donghaiensis]